MASKPVFAAVVCPGGGFHSLSIMQEGYGVVKWLQSKGITAFLLKSRLMHIQGSDPYQQENEDRTRKAADTERAVVADMAIADGRQALSYVRTHAADYGIDPKRIGIIGFSAGGVISNYLALGAGRAPAVRARGAATRSHTRRHRAR